MSRSIILLLLFLTLAASTGSRGGAVEQQEQDRRELRGGILDNLGLCWFCKDAIYWTVTLKNLSVEQPMSPFAVVVHDGT